MAGNNIMPGSMLFTVLLAAWIGSKMIILVDSESADASKMCRKTERRVVYIVATCFLALSGGKIIDS